MLKKLFRKFLAPDSNDTVGASAPTLISAKTHQLDNGYFSRNSVQVAKRLQEAGFQAYLVGGCVRDSLLGLRPKDFDVATSATPEQISSLFRNSRIIGRRFKLVHIHFGREIIETATFRGSHDDTGKNNDRSAHNDKGRILRDNVYGSLDDDALRRDFTINALYYDVSSHNIIDYAQGVQDIKDGLIRLIGDPSQRYLEDPVRMLRAIRFAAKLGFTLEAKTAEPIRQLAHLLKDIPAARLYEEVLKLFMNGKALKTYELLQEYNLFAPLFPETAHIIASGSQYASEIVRSALKNTDERISANKPVTPAFLFAALLWPGVPVRTTDIQNQGIPAFEASQEASHWVLHNQLKHTAIPKRFSIPMREIWSLQERLTRRQGKRADVLLAHPRFRAAYDFLLLRESAGEQTTGLGQWWTEYQFADDAKKRSMIKEVANQSGTKRKRTKHAPRQRKPRTHTNTEN
ncbi:polynucleotide adenylyltransferase PcnB [Pseudomonas sp. F1_0610]|uniref:polynucleotide adenylyltransferase PcnB n=1 Tax=Pseudomonas sp. F1_0610 TaxID=3114284 RepID=UPI0039C2EEF8